MAGFTDIEFQPQVVTPDSREAQAVQAAVTGACEALMDAAGVSYIEALFAVFQGPVTTFTALDRKATAAMLRTYADLIEVGGRPGDPKFDRAMRRHQNRTERLLQNCIDKIVAQAEAQTAVKN